MRDWKHYWNHAPKVRDPDPLKQVGKTVNGEPISRTQFEALVADVWGGLALESSDLVLDLGCGNGLVTRALAERCAAVVGVDFSEPLLASARARAPANAEYLLADVCQLPVELQRRRITKILMYEALQHLDTQQASQVFEQVRASPWDAPMFLGSIPDREQLDLFYDTAERRADYEDRVKQGTEDIGHWWTREALGALLEEHGLEVRFLRQNPCLNGQHYRFDAVVTRCATGRRLR